LPELTLRLDDGHEVDLEIEPSLWLDFNVRDDVDWLRQRIEEVLEEGREYVEDEG
jgi:hypothetical protein